MTAAPPVASLLDLSGKTAIVTGASGGIGAGIALRFGEAGASVVCHYNSNRQATETVAEAIRSAGRQAVACQADIASGTGAANLVAQAISHFGGVDILVNNAGQQPVEMLAEMSESNWNAMMGANVAGPFLLVRAFAEHAGKLAKPGSVVNIASIEGHNPAPGHGHYATSKAALLMFTKAAALEFGAHGIRVNSICPGLIHRDEIEDGWREDNLILRDLEEMMAERGLNVDHSTVHRWVVHFSPQLLERFNRRKRTVTGKWHMDETYIKVRGQWTYLYRAIDSVGDTVEFLFSENRDLRAARRFLRKTLERHGRPNCIVIDGSQTNHEAIIFCDAENRLRDRSRRSLKPIHVRKSKYRNNRIEQDHRRVKRRIRCMLGFKSLAKPRSPCPASKWFT